MADKHPQSDKTPAATPSAVHQPVYGGRSYTPPAWQVSSGDTTPPPAVQRTEITPADPSLIQRDGPTSSTAAQRRVLISNILLALPMPPLVALVNALGFEISGIAAGLRESVTADVGVGVGGGVDEMFMFDFATLQPTGDVVPYAELGIGVQAGWGVGVVIALRLSPRHSYGSMRGSYSGAALNASFKALAGVSFSLSPGILSGGEGFAGVCISVGGEAGMRASVSYAVSSVDFAQEMAQSARSTFNGIVSGLSSASRALSGVAGGITDALIVRPILVARAKTDIANWDLSPMPTRARQNLNMIGLTLGVFSDTPDHFLEHMGQPLRNFGAGAATLLNELAQDLTQTLHARGGMYASVHLTSTFLGGLNLVSLVDFLVQWNLMRFSHDPAAIAEAQMGSR